MNTKNVTIGALIVAVVVFAGLSLRTKNTVTEVRTNNVGAVSSPDIPYPYIAVSGVRTEYSRQELNTATTTLCSIATPTSTSTLSFFSAQIKSGLTMAITVSLASSTQRASTSTDNYLILDKSIASGATADIVFVQGTTTETTSTRIMRSKLSTGDSNFLFPPNVYLLLRLGTTSTATGANMAATGACQAEFKVL